MPGSKDVAKVKDQIGANQDKLQAAWKRLDEVLDFELAEIREKGAAVIPELSLADIIDNGGKINETAANKIKKRGVVIIRNVISKLGAEETLSNLRSYMIQNGENPDEMGRTFFEVYWSKPQLRIRHHPNMIVAQKALLALWSSNPDLDSKTDLTKPLTYNDRMRFRKPGDGSFSLQPHLDSGSFDRWSDPIYRLTYQKIFDGHWELYDPFKLNGRGQAVMDDHCSFFRAFQGWTSLTQSGPGDGTLRVLPLLKESMAYIMMRPLLDDIKKNDIPGYEPGELLKPPYNLHDKIIDAMVSLPTVHPGDSVWWHADTLHSVESEHRGRDTNVVLYIPVGPDCPVNRLYVERARLLLMKGLRPPDFNSRQDIEHNFKDRGTVEDLTDEAKIMMGF